MDFEDLIEPGFDDVNLFRTICDLTRSLENMDDIEQLEEHEEQEPSPDNPSARGSSAIVATPNSAVMRLEPLNSNPQQPRASSELPTLSVHEGANSDSNSLCTYFKSRDQLDVEIEGGKGLITSLAAGSSKSAESSGRKKSVRKTLPESSPNCSEEGANRYNFRKRSASLNYKEKGARDMGLVRLETPSQAGSRSKKNRGETPKETDERKSAKLRFSVSRFIAQVDTENDWVDGRSSSSSNSEGRSTSTPNRRGRKSQSIRTNCRQKILSAKMDFDGHSVTLCRKSESAFYSRVGSRSTPLKARQWKRDDWERFFLIFSAMAAEAHTVKGLKTRKTEACRRWLSCMRNILSTPPF